LVETANLEKEAAKFNYRQATLTNRFDAVNLHHPGLSGIEKDEGEFQKLDLLIKTKSKS